jgi:thiol-disulfide isomerase/thioredoxin
VLKGAMLIGVALAAGCAHGSGRVVDLGEVVEFDLAELSGRRVRARDLRGRAVLVDVWATWCAPCQTSLPFYADLRARLSGYRFEVVTVSIDEDADALAAYLRERPFPFPVLRDPEARLLAHIGSSTTKGDIWWGPVNIKLEERSSRSTASGRSTT